MNLESDVQVCCRCCVVYNIPCTSEAAAVFRTVQQQEGQIAGVCVHVVRACLMCMFVCVTLCVYVGTRGD
jgi:hypothetical protein